MPRESESHVVHIGRTLSHQTFDTAVRSARCYYESGWTGSKNLAFDLETLEYADFGAAARFVALTEGLVRRGFGVHIVLPNPDIRAGEQNFLDTKLATLQPSQQESQRRDLERRVEQRRRLRGFLRHIGVLRALQFTHLP